MDHDFHEMAQGVRFTISEVARREVLGCLLELNHARYEEEVKMGLHSKKAKAKGKKAGVVSGRQGSLPGLEDDRPRQLGLFGEE